jgi:hypothetical protein
VNVEGWTLHDLPPELQKALENTSDQYDRDRNAELLKDWEPLFAALRELHQRHPDWRFGQLVANLASWSGKTEPGDAYSVPDERLLETALRHLADHARRAAKTA